MSTLPRSTPFAVPALGIALLVAAPWSAGATSGALTVSAQLDPVDIRVGDVARLTVSVEHPAAAVPTLPEIARGKAIAEVDRRQETAPLKGGAAVGRERTVFVISLTSFEVGEHGVGGGAVSATDRSGAALAAPLPATVLRTRSLLSGESTPMRGAREPLRWPAPRRRWIVLAAGLLLAAAVVLAGVHRRRSVRRPPAAVRVAATPPHERALQALAALRRRTPSETDPIERHVQEVAAIVRRYLEERFGLHAPERTTEELAVEVASSGRLAPAQQEQLRNVLAECDLVKFARRRPSPEDLSRALVAAERLVRETRPPAESAPSQAKRAGA